MTTSGPASGHRPAPAMSVVVAIDGERQRAARCLRSLVGQAGIERFDIIVLDMAYGHAPPIEGAGHPAVRVLPLPRGTSYGAALAMGARASSAPVVSFIEEHVVALPGWADAIMSAHAAGLGAVIGSEMWFDNPGRGASDLIDILSNGPWTAPAVRGDASAVRWQNVSYSRAALGLGGDDLPRYLDAEACFFTRIRAAGLRLWIEPSARLSHANERDFAFFLVGSFISNRLVAATRAELQAFSPLRRLLHAAAALVSGVRAPAYILRGLNRRPEFDARRRFARRRLLHITIYSCVFSLGAATGFLLGRGRSGERFLEHHELNAVRDLTGDDRVGAA